MKFPQQRGEEKKKKRRENCPNKIGHRHARAPVRFHFKKKTMRATFALVASSLVLVCVLRTLKYFSAKNNPSSVKMQVFLSWTLSVSILTLVPLDVGYALSRMNDGQNGEDNNESGSNEDDPGNASTTMGVMWGLTYWSTFFLTWVILPLHQIYEDSGDFTFASRCATALRENMIFYGVLVGILFVGATGLLFFGSLDASSLSAYGIVVANAWGISTGILLVGYGLVEVPRALYKRSFLDDRPTRAYKRVAHVSRSLQEAHEDLKKVCRAVATTARVMPRRHELRWAMEIIESEVPDAETLRVESSNSGNTNTNNSGLGPSSPMQAAGSNRRGSYGEMNAMGVMMDDDDDDAMLDYDYDLEKDLARLRRRLKRSLRVYRRTRAQYVEAVEDAFQAEATYQTSRSTHGRLIKPPSAGGGIVSQDLLQNGSALRDGGGASSPSSSIRSIRDSIEKFYRCTFEPMTCKVLAFSFGFLSLAIILAESTIWTGDALGEHATLSLFGVIVEHNVNNALTLHLAIFVPLFYVCFCAYLSLGRLGMFSFYTLVPYGTDSLSLLFNASLVCRYSAPLAYNFLALLPVLSRPSVPPTTFAKKMAEHIPEAAQRFNTIVPGFLAIYCALIAFDAFDGIASYGWKILCCCCPARLRGGSSGRSSLHHRTSIGSDGFGSNMIGDQNAFHFASAKDEEMEDDSLGRSIVDRERAEIIEGGRLGCASPEYYFDEPSPSNARARGSKNFSSFTRNLEEEQISIDDDEDRLGGGAGGRNLESVNLLSGTGVGSSSSPSSNRDERWAQSKERLKQATARAAAANSSREPGAKQTAHLDSMFSGLRPPPASKR